jgi:hypothetical protein
MDEYSYVVTACLYEYKLVRILFNVTISPLVLETLARPSEVLSLRYRSISPRRRLNILILYFVLSCLEYSKQFKRAFHT